MSLKDTNWTGDLANDFRQAYFLAMQAEQQVLDLEDKLKKAKPQVIFVNKKTMRHLLKSSTAGAF